MQCLSRALLFAAVLCAANSTEAQTSPLPAPANWYLCKERSEIDCVPLAADLPGMPVEDVGRLLALMRVVADPARASRAELVAAIGVEPDFDRQHPSGVQQYAWREGGADRKVVALAAVSTFEGRIVSATLLRFGAYHYLWSPMHPSPPLAALVAREQRIGNVRLSTMAPRDAGAAPLLRLAHVGPLSGPIAHLGRDNENGARLAVEEVNARGGVLIGGERRQIELVAADDRADPAEGRRVAEALVKAKVDAVIGHLNSGTSLPAAPIYAAARIVQISPSASNRALTSGRSTTVFRMIGDDGKQGAVLLRYAVSVLDTRDLALVHDDSTYGIDLAASVGAEAARQRVNLATWEQVNLPTPDFAPIVARLLRRPGGAPRALIYLGMDTEAARLVRELKRAGVNTRVLSGDGACSPQFIELAGDAAAMLTCTQLGRPVDYSAFGGRFAARFQRRFSVPVQVFAPHAYDAVHALVAAWERAGTTEPAAVAAALRAAPYVGIADEYRFDENGDLMAPAVSVFQIRDGTLAFDRVMR